MMKEEKRKTRTGKQKSCFIFIFMPIVSFSGKVSELPNKIWTRNIYLFIHIIVIIVGLFYICTVFLFLKIILKTFILRTRIIEMHNRM